MYELRGYIDEAGRRRFAKWFDSLNASAAAKVTVALTRMEQRQSLEYESFSERSV